ncbi:MAG: tetratricopeptide repeat protein [Ignavibacterium sp.]|nr:tetratricopeptide repeat protein [Ignavibacterium sp.]
MNCNYCGFKLEQNFNFCPNCGAKLVNKKKNSPQVKDAHSEVEKSLPKNTIYTIVIGGILLTFLILYVSGVFSGPQVTKFNNTAADNNQTDEQSVDLSNIQKINELEAKVKSNPNDHSSLLELAHLRMDSGMFEQAIQNYKEYLKHHPKEADVIVDMAVCYFNLKNYDTAISYFKEAIKIKPDHQIAHLNMGVVLLNKGEIENSREWFKKAVEIDPKSDAGKKAQQLLTSH